MSMSRSHSTKISWYRDEHHLNLAGRMETQSGKVVCFSVVFTVREVCFVWIWAGGLKIISTGDPAMADF